MMELVMDLIAVLIYAVSVLVGCVT